MNEAENTARILKEQPLLVTSRWCMFGFHKWEKWGKPYIPKKGDNRHIQTRNCAACNEVQVRDIHLPHWINS